jgi:hypothetical protein
VVAFELLACDDPGSEVGGALPLPLPALEPQAAVPVTRPTRVAAIATLVRLLRFFETEVRRGCIALFLP